MDSLPIARIVSGLTDATLARGYAVASWALFMYEYFITFDQEVMRIWRPRGSYLLKLLWGFNRYTFFMSFTPALLVSLISVTPEMFVKFPAATQIVLNASAGGTLILRTYALYACQKWVLFVLIPILLIVAAVESWAVTLGVPVKLPPGLSGCLLTGKPADGNLYAVYWVGQLVFPTVVFGMTVGRILLLRQEGLRKGTIIDVLLRDGVIYFAVIFLANLVNVVTFVFASQSLQQINAPFTEMITAVMICRLILNLRSDGKLESMNANEISESQHSTRRGELRIETRKGKLESSAESPTYFDSQPGSGSIGGFESDYVWEMELDPPPSGSVLAGEGRNEKRLGKDLA